MNEQLFEGGSVTLAPLDADRDAEVEARWTHDPEYLRLISADPARPLSPGQIKKKYEDLEKEADKSRAMFNFAIRAKTDDRLIGFVRLFCIEWTHGGGALQLAIGNRDDRGKGYGTEALHLILRYAFDELNLHRISAETFEYNSGALRFLERAGFRVEVRRRQAINRDNRRWDALMLGLLRDDWQDRQ
jgi:RimJ/RimL family protein N-acetyltransferase